MLPSPPCRFSQVLFADDIVTIKHAPNFVARSGLLPPVLGRRPGPCSSQRRKSWNSLPVRPAALHAVTRNKIRLGNTGVTVIEGQVAFSFPSDKTQKENFKPMDGEEVLGKIRQL